MQLKSIVCWLLFAATCSLHAQQKNEPVLMTVNGTPITLSEFEYSYHKNNTQNTLDNKSLEDYVKLYTNFKLKVEEAKAQGLDTTKAFVNEYNNYRGQLADPYLQDSVPMQQTAQKIYNRIKDNVEVSHILLMLPRQTFPKDTLEVWNKIMNIRKQIVDGKADFNDIAATHSEDPSAKQSTPAGYMGWTAPMMFVDEFEDAMYATSINSVSMPIRTQFGYHLIKVHNRRPNPGEVKVAHIMFGFRPDMTNLQKDSIKTEAEKVYQKAQSGEDFAKLAKQYSTDNYSKDKGGEMNWFGVARMPKEFENASFALKKREDISPLITTKFGYHIIKLIDKKPMSNWKEAKKQIEANLERGMRKNELTALRLERLKKENQFKMHTGTYTSIESKAKTQFPTDSAFINDVSNSKKVLFEINNNKYLTSDFANYLNVHKQPVNPLSTEDLRQKFNQYLLDTFMKAKDQSLAEKHPEFRFLSQEYHDGILLFEVMNREVWEKSQQDTTGLETFFAQNRAKYNWNTPKYVGKIILCKDDYSRNKIDSLLQTHPQKITPSIKQLQSIDEKIKIKIETGTWVKGENDFVDYTAFRGETAPATTDQYPLYIVQGTMKKNPDLNDIRGEVISDYQIYLEKKLLNKLHKKFNVKINKGVLRKVK